MSFGSFATYPCLVHLPELSDTRPTPGTENLVASACASPKLCPCPKNQQFFTISSISRFAMAMVHVQLRPAEFGTGGPLVSFGSQTTSRESGASPATRGTEV